MDIFTEPPSGKICRSCKNPLEKYRCEIWGNGAYCKRNTWPSGVGESIEDEWIDKTLGTISKLMRDATNLSKSETKNHQCWQELQGYLTHALGKLEEIKEYGWPRRLHQKGG